MSEPNYDKEPRWRNAGYWTNAYDDPDREGDREHSRDYDRDDMRRYARRSVEQGGRLRDMRGGSQDEDDVSSMGRASQNRGYDAPWQRGAHGRGGPRQRDDAHYGWSVRGDWDAPHRDSSPELEDIRDIRRRPGGRLGSPRPGSRSGRQDESYDPRQRGYDAIDNYWGERAQNRSYGGRRDPGWVESHDPNQDDWWDQTGGRPGFTSARRPGNNDINQSRRDQSDFESRGYDMDPGFAYEFGTDFDFMTDARRAEVEARWREQQRLEQQAQRDRQREQRRDQRGNDPRGPELRGAQQRGQRSWWPEGDQQRPGEHDYGSHGSGQSQHRNRAQEQRQQGRSPYRSPRDQGEQAGQRYRQNWQGRPDNMSFRYSREWDQGPYTGVGPQDYKRSDERIREDINEIFTRNGRIDAAGVNVRVEDGEVTLTGEVNSRNEKHLANDIAESVPGVREVINRLRVAPDADLY